MTGRSNIGISKRQHLVFVAELTKGMQQVMHFLSSLLGLTRKENFRTHPRKSLFHFLQNGNRRIRGVPGHQQNLQVWVVQLEVGPKILFKTSVDPFAGKNQSGRWSKLMG